MANPAVGAAASSGSGLPASTGARPFWAASNYYVQKNNDQLNSGNPYQLTTTQKNFAVSVDSTGFLRGIRIMVRSTGGVGGTVSADNPWNTFQNLNLSNVGGSQLFNSTNGYESMLYNAYGRPWEGDPTQAYDYAQSINPSFTLKIHPEIRHTLCSLNNTDPRQQYRLQGNFNTFGNVVTSGTTAATLTTTVFVDTWAQPDTTDLQGVTNESAPAGSFTAMNFRRNQTFSLNGASSNNTFIFTEGTGNLLRNVFIVVRDSNGVRQDYLSDPLDWYVDSRIMGHYTPDMVQQYMEEFYGTTGTLRRPTGVYVFPRFFNPGTMTGQGWLETSNATGLKFQSSTAAGAVNTSGGTINCYSDEVVPLGEIPMELEDL